MDISLCVVTYERPHDIRRLLYSLCQQTDDLDEVIIVDDSETTDTEAVVAGFEELPITYIHRYDGSGMTEARNIAINRANGEIIAFVDDDVECSPDWIANLRDSWTTHSDAAAIGGPALLVDDDGEIKSDITRTAENQNVLNEYGEGRTLEMGWVPREAVKTDALGGANMSFRSSVLSEVNGFNPIYRGSEVYEDMDIMARLYRRGKSIYYDPSLQVKHYDTPKTGVDTSEEEFYYWGWNLIIFRYVCFPETFKMSILRLPFTSGWKRLGRAVVNDRNHLLTVKGYVDGLVHVLKHGDDLPVDRLSS